MAPGQTIMQPATYVLGDGLQDLRLQKAAIPTKQDMECYIKQLETAYKSEIQALAANMSHVSDQVQRLGGM